MKFLLKKRTEYCHTRGFTLIEQVMTVMVISLGILIWLNVVRIIHKGTLLSKNNLRAQNLAVSKMENFKSMAKASSYDNTWNSVTKSSLAMDYAQWNAATFNNKAYTWRVLSSYAYITPGGIVSAGWAGCDTCTANMITISAEVKWADLNGPKFLSLTGSATDYRSN